MDKPSPVHIRMLRITGGLLMVVAGVLMLVLPGPGILALIAGFALLAKDFPWAQRVVDWMHDRWADARKYVSRRSDDVPDDEPGGAQTEAA
jgi:UPF0716 family protein affecting phage T7 exclusion